MLAFLSQFPIIVSEEVTWIHNFGLVVALKQIDEQMISEIKMSLLHDISKISSCIT